MSGGGTILVVDDNQAVRDSTAEILDVAGYSVTTSCDSDNAVATLTAGGIDLVLLDLGLSESPGLLVLDRVEKLPPVLVMSGTYLGDADITPADIHPRVCAFLRKPVAPERLLEEVARWLPRTA